MNNIQRIHNTIAIEYLKLLNIKAGATPLAARSGSAGAEVFCFDHRHTTRSSCAQLSSVSSSHKA
jgi:hypothetical protein